MMSAKAESSALARGKTAHRTSHIPLPYHTISCTKDSFFFFSRIFCCCCCCCFFFFFCARSPLLFHARAPLVLVSYKCINTSRSHVQAAVL